MKNAGRCKASNQARFSTAWLICSLLIAAMTLNGKPGPRRRGDVDVRQSAFGTAAAEIPVHADDPVVGPPAAVQRPPRRRRVGFVRQCPRAVADQPHVALHQLQNNSTAEHDYVRDGFYAATPDAEMKSPDLEVNVLQSMDDVTARVAASVKPGMTDKGGPRRPARRDRRHRAAKQPRPRI